MYRVASKTEKVIALLEITSHSSIAKHIVWIIPQCEFTLTIELGQRYIVSFHYCRLRAKMGTRISLHISI